MHIPDGFLDPFISITSYAIFIAFSILAFYRAGRFDQERVSLVVVLAATIFAAQMISWPIIGGTSLHFVGGALAGIILGPYLGFATMSLVLIVQCLVFHDGGITALGANALNMAIIDVLVGYAFYRALERFGGKGTLIGAFLGGWAGMALAGVAAGIEIGASRSFTFGLEVAVPVMAVWHMALGVIEGAITASVVAYLRNRAPFILGVGG